MRAAREPPRRSVPGKRSTRPRRTLVGVPLDHLLGGERRPWVRFRRIHLDCTTCTATWGSGAATSTTPGIMNIPKPKTRAVRLPMTRRRLPRDGMSWLAAATGAARTKLRSAYRGEQFPWHRTAEIGFRVAKADSPDWEQKLRDVAQRDAATTLSGHTETIMSLAFSPDGKTLASASDDRTIKLWVVATGKNTATLGGHTDHVLSVAFSPDGKTLASGSQDETIKLWEIATGNNIATFKGHNRGVASVVFSPDGRTLVSGSWDKSIKLWDVTAGHQTAVLDGHTWAVRFSPDGKSLASAGADKTIKLWDIASGKNTAILKGHVTVIHCLAYHPDGKTLASASGESAIKLWDTATGKNFATLQQDSGKIYYVAFSPDGKTLASACARQNDCFRLHRRRHDSQAVGPGHGQEHGRYPWASQRLPRGGIQPGWNDPGIRKSGWADQTFGDQSIEALALGASEARRIPGNAR